MTGVDFETGRRCLSALQFRSKGFVRTTGVVSGWVIDGFVKDNAWRLGSVRRILRVKRIAICADSRSALHLFHTIAYGGDGQPPHGIESGKGLVVLTGEVGTGKTTILRWMMQRLDRTVLVAYIFNPRLSVTDFYHHAASHAMGSVSYDVDQRASSLIS